MDSFLFSTVPQVIRLAAEKVPWHYNTLCEHCGWRAECRRRTREERTVSLIPNLNIEDAAFLREVIKLGDGDTTDIEELDALVHGGLQKVEQMYPTTAARFRNLMGMKQGEIGSSPVIEAIKLKEPQVIKWIVPY
jgi:predicted RecB family nuclease